MVKMLVTVNFRYNQSLVMDTKDVALLAEILGRSLCVNHVYLGDKGEVFENAPEGLGVTATLFKKPVYTPEQIEQMKKETA